MTAHERDDRDLDGCDELLRRRYPECRCNGVAHGGCRCEDDGDVTHGGADVERIDWEATPHPRIRA